VTAELGSVTRVGAYVLCRDAADRILLCRIAEPTSERGRWTLPGGGLDFGETPEAGAVRELLEETGLVAELEGIAGTFSVYREQSRAFAGRPLHWVAIIYRGRVVDGRLRHELHGSTDRCDWFDESAARELPLVDLGRRGIDLCYGPG
jgi:8-oxo-dGTP diphosphatase